MKKTTLRTKIIATVLSVLMLIPMLTFDSLARSVDSNTSSSPIYELFVDEEECENYNYELWMESYSSLSRNEYYTAAYMVFDPTEYAAVTKEVEYTVNHRVDYILERDFVSDTFYVYLTPGMDTWYGDWEDDYIRIDYDLNQMELCQYIFATANLDMGQIRTTKAYFGTDFTIHGY
jgi:hypothetical protein